jgi:hypothetical protein
MPARVLVVGGRSLSPSGALVWQHRFGAGYVVEVRSPRLAPVLAASEIGDPGGFVQLVLDNHEADGGRPSYSQTGVTGAVVASVIATSASKFAGC